MKDGRYSTKRSDAQRTTAIALNYFTPIDDLRPSLVVLLLRVSHLGQAGHLKDQEAHLRRELEKRGCKVVAVFKEIVTGWAEDRATLERAAVIAKSLGAVLVAESGCRFVRGSRKRGSRYDVLPSVWEMERFMYLVDGVQLATLHHPDTDWTVVRGEQTKRGQQSSGNYGGRPTGKKPGWKKARRESQISEVLKLNQAGKSYREISRLVGVPRSTVRDWIKRCDDHS